MKKYLKLMIIIVVVVIIILGVTAYEEYTEIQYQKTKIYSEFDAYLEQEWLLRYIDVNIEMYEVIKNMIPIILSIVFLILLIYIIINYRKNKEIDSIYINILLILLLNIVLFIRTNIRVDVYEFIDNMYNIIFSNILDSICIVIIGNLILKKSIYRWIVATIALYIFNMRMLENFIKYNDDLKFIVLDISITAIIIIIAYLIKNIINSKRNLLKNNK